MTKHRRKGVGGAVALMMALVGCQNHAAVGHKAEISKRNATATKPDKIVAREPIAAEPVYIDLGPIETVALTTVPPETIVQPFVPVEAVPASASAFDQVISPSDAVATEQLRLAPTDGVDLIVEQPSGALSDRCDPGYWGGAQPPADLGCDDIGQTVPRLTEYQALQPGTYIRLPSKTAHEVTDANLLVRKVGEADTEFSEEAIGAVLLVGSRRSGRPQLSVIPIPVEDTAVPSAFPDQTAPSLPILLPRS